MMIRRAFVRALSGAILTTLLGVKAWRLEEEPVERVLELAELDGYEWEALTEDTLYRVGLTYADGRTVWSEPFRLA